MQATTRARSVSDKAVAALRAALKGPVLVPRDSGYDDARRAWNAMVDKRPAVIARCADANDVVAAIRFARAHDLEIGVRCGGHSVLGQAIPHRGMMIDLGLINRVTVDAVRRLARVGGGAVLGNLDRASLEHGLATTAGNVSHTGVGGLTLGGGMGWLARQHGLACDNVVSYRVVLADGSQATASESENPDLFWGLRGGGGNFGVVTEFTFRLHPNSGRALGVDLFFAAVDAADVIRAWRDFALEAPPEATPTLWTGTAGEWGFLPPKLHGQRLVDAGFVWVGDPDAGRKLLPRLRSFGPVAAELVEELSYLELQTQGDEDNRHGMRRYWKSHYLNRLGDDAIEGFLARGGPVGEGELMANGFMQAYGGAIGAVAPGESAFSHRDTTFEFVTMAGWEDPAEDERRMGACRRFAAGMEPFASGVYVNGLADEGALGVRHAYAAETLSRLTKIKDRYDPANVFHLNHNIAPTPR